MKKRRLIAIALTLFLAVVAAGRTVAPTFAQKVLTREAICVERTYGEGSVVPPDEFSNVDVCNDYIRSYIQHYDENAFSAGEANPADNEACGEQGQYACVNGCDPGYKVTDFGTCVALGVSSDQMIAFRDCQDSGGDYTFCEASIFGGSALTTYGQKIDECIRLGGSPENCQSACNGNVGADCLNIETGTLTTCVLFIDNGLNPGDGNWNSLGCGVLNNNFGQTTSTAQTASFRASLNECESKISSTLSEQVKRDRQRTCLQQASFGSGLSALVLAPENTTPQQPAAAVAYVPSRPGNDPGAASRQEQLEECTRSVGSTNVTADDCAALINANPEADLNGREIADCLLQRGPNYDGALCKNLNPPLSTFVSVRSGTTTQPPRNVAIADCAKAGISAVDCQNVLDANPGRQLSGTELASCIRGRRTNDGLCDGMKGLDTVPAVVSCAELGTCVNGRTCVKNQATGGLSNIGASCGFDANLVRVIADRQLSPVCDPTTNTFPANAEDGGICCGGGKSECASGICNAAVGEVGLCSSTATTTGGGVSGAGGGEINTGVSDEVRTDCSKVNGIVQNVEGSGFVVKCDFDGNGTFGYHQPTQFIYGNEAAAACRVLCLDPEADIEEAARERYRELQVEAAGANSSSSNTNANAGLPPGATTTEVTCETGAFESPFACVSWNRGPCIVGSNGCYRKVTDDEKSSVCPAVHQQSAYRCSEVWGEGCKIHPETGCYARDTIVAAATVEFADAINDGKNEIQTQSINIVEQAFNAGAAAVGGLADSFNSFWGQIAGGVQSNNGQQGEQPVDPAAEPPAEPVDGLEILNGGVGQTNGDPQNNGTMQVEKFCANRGGQLSNDGTNWYCTVNDTPTVYTQQNFTEICRETYSNENAVAMQIGDGDQPAFNWLCVAGQELSRPNN